MKMFPIPETLSPRAFFQTCGAILLTYGVGLYLLNQYNTEAFMHEYSFKNMFIISFYISWFLTMIIEMVMLSVAIKVRESIVTGYIWWFKDTLSTAVVFSVAITIIIDIFLK